jgi:hypothetical protein
LSASQPNTSSTPGVHIATLEQTFVVNPNNLRFGVIINLASDAPNQLFSAQTVTLYGPSGNVIAHHSYNNTSQSVLVFDLSAYAGQSVRLKFATMIDTRLAESPQNVSMEVDFGLKVLPPDPEPGQIGGN